MRINGKEEAVAAATLGELLVARGVDPATRYLAVAVNGAVVPRREWSERRLGDSDEVEIVRPREGG